MDKIEKIYKNKQVEIVDNYLKINNKVDLTIIVPVYNTEMFLAKCIDTLINQKTRFKYEIILINDGSKDDSLKVLKQYEKKFDFIKVFTQSNRGIAETRNVGIKNITGKYVAFVDSDDYVSTKYIEKMLTCAYKNDADIVRTNYYEYDVKNNRIIKTGNDMQSENITGDIGRKILNYKGYPWGGIFKSELWNNIQFPEGYWYEDMIIRMILFRKANKFSYINDKLYYYCIHENNISKSIEKTSSIKCLDQYYLIRELVKLSENIGLPIDTALYCNIMHEYGVVLWLRTRELDKNLRKMIFLETCKFITSIEINYNYNEEELILYNIFKRRDYNMWKLYAIYKMINIKYGVD